MNSASADARATVTPDCPPPARTPQRAAGRGRRGGVGRQRRRRGGGGGGGGRGGGLRPPPPARARGDAHARVGPAERWNPLLLFGKFVQRQNRLFVPKRWFCPRLFVLFIPLYPDLSHRPGIVARPVLVPPANRTGSDGPRRPASLPLGARRARAALGCVNCHEL